MNSLISFILVVGVLTFVHELGHFLLAKLFGVRVLKFSLGFGKKLISKKWGETEYMISALPLGGYVMMFDEQPDEKISEEEQAVSFSHKTVWQRFGIVLAGPLFNLLFAVFLFWLMFMFIETPKTVPFAPVIDQVSVGSAAQKAGLKEGDTIMKINGLKIESWWQILSFVSRSEGREMTLAIERNKELLTVKVTPILIQMDTSREEKRYTLGIHHNSFAKKNPFDALVAACVETWDIIITILNALIAACVETWDTTVQISRDIIMIFKKMIPASQIDGPIRIAPTTEQELESSQIIGPIRIAEIAGQQLETGWWSLIKFIAIMSVNIGMFNLLPIPVLDGGHLVFLSIEAVRRKPLAKNTIIWAHLSGMFLLIALTFFVFYNDIAYLIRHGW